VARLDEDVKPPTLDFRAFADFRLCDFCHLAHGSVGSCSLREPSTRLLAGKRLESVIRCSEAHLRIRPGAGDPEAVPRSLPARPRHRRRGPPNAAESRLRALAFAYRAHRAARRAGAPVRPSHRPAAARAAALPPRQRARAARRAPPPPRARTPRPP